MQTLTDMFQYDIGRDMRLHHSTFLWFIPFVHSLMDLKGLGVAYSMVVIQHLCSEVKEVLHHTVQPCDKVSQFFIWILVTVVELNLKKKCFNTLWVSSQNWVEVVVTCARLPSMAFACRAERDLARNGPRSLTKVPSWEPDSIQSACMNLIRLLLKEGYQMGQKASPFLNELNLLRRSHEDWKLSPLQARELQMCLIEIIRSLWTKSTRLFSKQEGRSPGYLPQEHSTYQSPRRQDKVFQEGTLSEKKYSLEEEAKRSICGEQSHQRHSEFHLANIKQELKESLLHEDHMLHSTGGPTDAQNSGSSHSRLMKQNSSLNQGSFDKVVQKKDTSGKEEKPRIIDADLHQWPSSSALEEKQISKKFTEKMKSNKADLTLKLKQFVQNRKRQLGPESEKQQSIKDEKQDQEEMTRRTSGDGSCMSSWALSLENGFQAKTLSIKKEPRDSLAEFKSAWKSGAESEESSTDDELNVPLLEIRKELIRKKLMVQAMEPEIDREGKLCLVAGRESTLSYQNPNQRKVQGALRSLSESESHTLSSEAGGPSNQVIIISDTSSDEEENKVNLSRRSQEENLSVSLQKDPEANEQDAITVSSSPLMYGECESQCFEFETEEEIYSAWQDSQLDKTTEADVFPVKTADRSASSDLELARHLDEQDYDTDHLGHDIIEKNEQELEQQVKIDTTRLKLPVQADEKNVGEGSTAVGSKYFTAMHANGQETPKQSSASTSSTPLPPPPSGRPLTPSLEPAPRPSKSLAKSKWLNTAQRSPEKRRLVTEEKSPCATPSGSPHPFVVPPKKVHHFPEPTSTVEKLGLKKRARRAAELSQRSHDVVAQLRSYGKAAGQLPQKRRRAKLIEPRRMVIRNKVLLASQERHFFRQSRPKKKEKGDNVPRAKRTFLKPPVASTSKEEVENVKGKPSQFSHSSNHVKKLLPQHSQGDDGSHSAPPEREALPSSRQDPLKPDSDVPGSSTSAPGSACSSSEVGSSSPDSSSDQRSKNLSENASGLKEDLNPEENEDDLFLTQRDPVDMELCSQMDSSSHPEDTVVLPTLQDPPQAIENCRHPGCPKKMEGAGPFCQGHSLPNSPDHVFAKPCAPPKPSIKKIFSSSAASRIASLSKDLETSSTHVAAAKTSKADGVRTKLTLVNLLCPSNMNNLSTQPPNSHVIGNASKMPVPRSDTGQEARPFFARVNSSHNQPRDHSIFTKEIVKWSYDMFANFRELGPPSHLLQALVISVPHDVENKYHPKDDDLVLLTVSDKRFYDEREGENQAIQHVGFVTRFSHPCIHNAKTKEQQVTCHLSIQTQGNLSRIEKELPYMRDFNEGQRRAIESAYAMITQHPSSPKICLIHGPPGTGKSKVIVGLLHRILDERSGKENAVQRLNAKIKTNRILVCAPSNAAIDNLMKKIILEFKKYREKNALGNCGDINLVRLGQQKSINSEVRKFSLDDQVDRKINLQSGLEKRDVLLFGSVDKAMLGKHQDLQKRKEDLDRQLDTLSRLRAMDRSENGEKKQQLEDEICQLSKERQCLASQLKEARGRSQELKASIILESHIICCTLSTSGGMLLKSAFRRLGGDPVSCVIVDEFSNLYLPTLVLSYEKAGQTCEIETLIPLIHGCKKLVLVGDPEQLPPTIKSLKAQDHSYDQSLIDRLCKHLKEQDQENISGKFPVFQLTVQYRMHPEICLFPSKYIYEGVLTTDR
ncbi:hypothetical protein Chor_002102 [Crotalus horridus]